MSVIATFLYLSSIPDHQDLVHLARNPNLSNETQLALARLPYKKEFEGALADVQRDINRMNREAYDLMRKTLSKNPALSEEAKAELARTRDPFHERIAHSINNRLQLNKVAH